MKTGRPPILEKRCKEKTGRTMAEYFDMAIGSRMTIRSMAVVLDVSPSTICNWAKANDKKWDTLPKCNLKFYGFEWRGFHGTQRQHCAHHGISFELAKSRAYRYRIPFIEAMQIAIDERDNPKPKKIPIKEQYKALGISHGNVLRIATDYGISMDDARDIALVRKKTREAKRAA